MEQKQAYHILLEGSSYEIGKKLGQMSIGIPGMVLNEDAFSKEEESKVYKLFDEFCPGINEEIEGFAEVLKVPVNRVLYYAMSYLKPGCSQMAVLPSKTSNGHVLMARNYDFSDKMEGMVLTTTRVKGKYSHISSAIAQFGRADGMNEFGLAVSQSSSGMPVGNFDCPKKPVITGLQFWAVIRAVLEKCKDVDEAVKLSMQMPIAFDINMIVADPNGNAALIESFDGKKAIKRIDAASKEQFICSTNHIHLPELKELSPLSIRNSITRYDLINQTLRSEDKIDKEDLRKLLSTKYPEGLCCHHYDDFFGNLRGMIFDITEGSLEICFGSPALNSWYTFKVNDENKQQVYTVELEREESPADFYDMI